MAATPPLSLSFQPANPLLLLLLLLLIITIFLLLLVFLPLTSALPS
jgi:hypothetical protein